MYNKILKEINNLLDSSDKQTVIVAVDGCCASGKSTLAEFLKDNFICNVFHMDDFFLTPDMKTSQRLNEAGGNVDYERFKAEILENVAAGKDFIYNIYDCHQLSFTESCKIFHKKLNIVEGVYSMHPQLNGFYDYKIFLDVDEEKKKERILSRSNEYLLGRFINEWIPLENRYFEAFGIKENCDMVIDTTDMF